MEPRGVRSESIPGAILPRGDLEQLISGHIDPRGVRSCSNVGAILPLGDLDMSGHIDPRGLLSNSILAILPRGLRGASGTSECLELRVLPFSGIKLLRGAQPPPDPGTRLFLGLRL